MRSIFLFVFSFQLLTSLAQSIHPPNVLFGDLFTDVQTKKTFSDSKTFVDCIPKRNAQNILSDYLKQKKSNPHFDLKKFVLQNFYLPEIPNTHFQTNEKNIVTHINNLWPVLRKKMDTQIKGSSLLPLPYDYIIPGGRFREIYYWDSYFTMLGLKESNRIDLIENMINNFAHFISLYGHIPNGNRTYYLSRSQPPFFSLMLELLASLKGQEIYKKYLPQLKKEYDYWMDGSGKTKHKVKMPDGSILNRYYDQLSIPRQESYREDVEIARRSKNKTAIYKNLRSAAESGWDFSSRWFKDEKKIVSIQTIDLLPIDLNCLLYHLELTLHKASILSGKKHSPFEKLAQRRKAAINKYFWSSGMQWFVDYNWKTKRKSLSRTLAGMFPFFLQIADPVKFAGAKNILATEFIKDGGAVTTLFYTGQQWDAPNGWAPLQWVTIQGLENYGESILSKAIAERWVALNKKVFFATGKLLEKYDVVDSTKESGGGEYPTQDGFGWTNGVLLALINKYNLK